MKAILHCDKKWGIGKNNDLMFHLPQDMKFFRESTKDKVVVMGWNTLLSLPQSKPLKNRINIVLYPEGDKAHAAAEGYILVRSLEELFAEADKYSPDDVYVIGGAMMYHTLLPYCSEVLLTKVDADGEAQAFFDNLDELPNWELVNESETIEDNGYNIKFCTYINREVKKF